MEHKKIWKEISFLIITAFYFPIQNRLFYELFSFPMKWGDGNKVKYVIQQQTKNAMKQQTFASRNDLFRAKNWP